METKYPINDLKREHDEIRAEIYDAIERVVESQRFILGPEVEAFEESLAAYCQTQYAVAVSSGTDALLAALMILRIGPGDEVIVPAYSFISTATVVSRLGATPVFVDINPITYNIQPQRIEDAITEHTKAIIPVHYAGQCADMYPILEVANSREIPVIEDACQAIGSEYAGKRAGSMGMMGCFSFFPTKNLGGYGDSGAIVTNNRDLAMALRMLRNHGQLKKYQPLILGGNFRMDEIQAAVLNVKLKYLDEYISWRRYNAMTYEKELEHSPVDTPLVQSLCNRHTYHLYIVNARKEKARDALRKHLEANSIATEVYYPRTLPEMDVFPETEAKYSCAHDASRTTMALPMRPFLFTRQIRTICEVIKRLP